MGIRNESTSRTRRTSGEMIAALDLTQHPEGGFYREIGRAHV